MQVEELFKWNQRENTWECQAIHCTWWHPITGDKDKDTDALNSRQRHAYDQHSDLLGQPKTR